MFGFGSSIFSSASTLITSAVQEQPKTTPPVSPKLSPAKTSPAKEAKTPVTQKSEELKKDAAKTTPASQAELDKGPAQPAKTVAASQAPAVKPGQSTCPLCKVQLNINTKDPPNYSNCTECKNTVCNKCGFSPMPNVSEGREWLCLNCQMQRALGLSEPPGLPMMKPSPKKEVPPTHSFKDSVTEPVTDKKEASDKPKVEENNLPAEATPTPLENAPPLLPQKAAPIAETSVLEGDNLPSQKPVPSGPTPPPVPDEVKQPSEQKDTTAPQKSAPLPVEGKEQPTKPVPSTPLVGKPAQPTPPTKT
uniref:Zinc finger piccolo-type domain-containing protein n=1 Tax=Neogobius melanostomus TaxID=47308 RepID=A0A8C6SJA2_9GOBI